jgi:hypothetical protein
MSRHTVVVTLAALVLASILTPAAARSFGPVALRISGPTPANHSPTDHHGFHPYPNYTNGFVAPFGLGTGGLGTGGHGGCPPSICGHPHPQVR